MFRQISNGLASFELNNRWPDPFQSILFCKLLIFLFIFGRLPIPLKATLIIGSTDTAGTIILRKLSDFPQCMRRILLDPFKRFPLLVNEPIWIDLQLDIHIFLVFKL